MATVRPCQSAGIAIALALLLLPTHAQTPERTDEASRAGASPPWQVIRRLSSPPAGRVLCSVGRFLVEGPPLIEHRLAGDAQHVSISGAEVSIGDACAAVFASVHPGRDGTRVRARWPACAGLPRGAELDAVIDATACAVLAGTFRAPGTGISRAFDARLVICDETAARGADGVECTPTDRLALKFQRALLEFSARAFPLGHIPKDGLVKAYHDTLVAENPFDKWVNIGPAPIGADASVPGDSGRADVVAVDPGNPNHWLLGTASGGVWETSNAGATWAPRTDYEPSLAIGALSFAPGAPDVVYAGTGTYTSDGGGGFRGAGMLKSLDGGTTWTLTGASTFAGLSMSAIKVSPANPDLLIAGALDGLENRWGFATDPSSPPPGLYRSTTGGASWSLRLEGLVTDVAVHPSNFALQYAGMATPMTSWFAKNGLSWTGGGGIYRSSDGGETWTLLKGPWKIPAETTKRLVGTSEIRFAVAPSDPNTLYVSLRDMWDRSGGLLGLWFTRNAWSPAPTWFQIPWTGPAFPGSPSGYLVGRPTHAITVHPSRPNVLYASGVRLWKYASGSWTDESGVAIHVDQNGFAWVGSRLIVANDGGVFSRDEEGSGPWQSHNTNLSTTQFYSGAMHPQAHGEMIGGAQDTGVLKRLNSSVPAWQNIFGGDGLDVLPGDDPLHWAFSLQTGLRRSKTGGSPSEFAAWTITDPIYWPRHARCPADANVALAGTKRLWRTTNLFSAATGKDVLWAPNSPPFTTTGGLLLQISAMAFAPSDASCQTYAVGTGAGALWLTTNGGGTWTELDTGNQVPDRHVTALAFDPDSAGTLYVALSGYDASIPNEPGHLFRTTTALAPAPSWTAIGPPVDLPHNAVAVAPFNPNVVYVGTDLGAWVTVDGGATWKHIGKSNGVPHAPVFHIHIDACGTTLFTFGRGAFRNAVPCL